MASAVDICNLALANLGHSAKVTSIAPPDGSVEASHCARFYPIARDLTLAKHDWAFASRRATLAEVAVDATVYGDYEYAYALPSDYIRFIGFVRGAGLIQQTRWDFQLEAKTDGSYLLLTDCPPEAANVRYVAREDNPARYPAAFYNVVAYELAAMLAGPIRKGGQREEMLKAAGLALLTAAGVDSNVDNRLRQERLDYKPPWIEGRE